MIKKDKIYIFILIDNPKLFYDDEKLIEKDNLKIEFKKNLLNENFLIPYHKEKNLISKYDIEKEARIIADTLSKRSEQIKSKSVLLICPSNPQIFNSIEKLNIFTLEFSDELLSYYLDYFKIQNIEYEKIEIEDPEILREIFEQAKNSVFIFSNPNKKWISNIVQYIPDIDIEIYINPVLKTKPEFNFIENYISSCMRRKIININTAKRFSRQWSKNFLLNSLKYVENKGVESLQNLLEGKFPIVIVGAGSSIDDCIFKIKKLANISLIIAVDTAVIPLQKADIPIDIIVSSDSQSINALYITCSDYIKKEKLSKDKLSNDRILPILVTMPTVHPLLISKFNGKIIFSSAFFSFVKEIDKITYERLEIGAGGTVSALAFDLLSLLNPSEIFLVGLDFCYSNGKLHCNNALFDSIYYSKVDYKYSYQTFVDKMILKSSSFIVKNEFGKKTRTDPKFMMFLDWFNNQIKLYDGKKDIYILSDKVYGIYKNFYIDDSKFEEYYNKKNILVKKVELQKKINKIEINLNKDFVKKYLNHLEKIKVESLSAKSMIESFLKRMRDHKQDLNSTAILNYLNSLDKNLLSFLSLKNLLTMSFQKYLLTIQYETEQISTVNFYEKLLEKLNEMIKIIEKISNY